MKYGMKGKGAMRSFFFALALVALSLTACPLDEIKDIKLQGIDLSAARDGTYEGACDTTLVKATVVITVRDKKLTDIKITRHDCGKGHPAEAITASVLAAQNTTVDAVSGATASSRVILKAIENAAQKAKEYPRP
jgi:uncharacterized protein with FMN-binding domain